MNQAVGILSFGAYIPYHRLDRSDIAEFLGTGGGSGRRSVASYDEDTTTMGAEAARIAWRDGPGSLTSSGAPAKSDSAADPGSPPNLDSLWFSTAWPAYAEKTNASAIHAVLRLPADVSVADFGGAARSGIGALTAAVRAGQSTNTMVVASDIRVGLPSGKDESQGGDAAAALVVGPVGGDAASGDAARDGATPNSAPGLAQCLAVSSATQEFTERWRNPGEPDTKQWEERFGESVYLPLADQALKRALEQAQLSETDIDTAIVAGTHSRSVKQFASRLSAQNVADSLDATVGNTGCAHALLLLAHELERAAADQAVGRTIAAISLIDGADVLIFKTLPAIADHTCSRPIARQIDSGGQLSYAKYLQWRQLLELQPPNRPEPARPSSAAAARSGDWKFGLVGSQGQTSQTIHLPPARVSIADEDPPDQMQAVAMADVPAKIATYTTDRLVYSVSPPVVFAIVDFEGGGRLPVELTDVAPDELEVGMPVEMTFRCLYSADGIHNYFWKARPQR